MASPAVAPTLCPVCETEVPPEAAECPGCGQAFEPLQAVTKPSPSPPKAGASRAKFLFYAGISLLLLGGPGVALGSWLHDVLRISYLNYNSFDVFGPMNRLVLALGLIVMLVGVVFLILSLRLSQPPERDVLA